MLNKEANAWSSILWGVARLLGTSTFAAMNAQGAVDEFKKTKDAYKHGKTKSAIGHGLMLSANAALAPMMMHSSLKNALVLKAYPKSSALIDEASKLGKVYKGKSLEDAVLKAKAKGLEAPPRFTKTTGYLQDLDTKGELPRQLKPAMQELKDSLKTYHAAEDMGEKAYKTVTPEFLQKALKLKGDLFHKIPYVGDTMNSLSISAPLIVGQHIVDDD